MGRYTSTSKGFYAFYQIYEDTAGRTGETAETVDHNSRILLKFIQIVWIVFMGRFHSVKILVDNRIWRLILLGKIELLSELLKTCSI